MCGGVEAREAEKVWKICFPTPRRPSRCCWKTAASWTGSPEQPRDGPPGGWAKLSIVQAGGWAK